MPGEPDNGRGSKKAAASGATVPEEKGHPILSLGKEEGTPVNPRDMSQKRSRQVASAAVHKDMPD